MNDWGYAQTDPSEELARLHLFSMKKHQDGKEIEFTITVKEFFTPKDGALLFFAQADKQTNQKAAPYTPCGWGRSLLAALSECVKAINRFPYQGEEARTAGA
ncbi:MAG TPA: hypothetical protein VJ732_03160 [Bryobacteraceae bacterium]|nr:hypothetical protein [Bryobacteraceae bacterium]